MKDFAAVDCVLLVELDHDVRMLVLINQYRSMLQPSIGRVSIVDFGRISNVRLGQKPM